MRMSDWSSDVCSSDLAFLDVIIPCVAFNNHAGSTKSYEYVREHNDAVNRMDVILPRAEIAVEYGEGKLIEVEQHDGSLLRLRKLDAGYDPRDRIAAVNITQQRHAPGDVITGLLSVAPADEALHGHPNTHPPPPNTP